MLRGQSAPGHLAGQAELVEPRWVVVLEASREDLRFPIADRQLDTAELIEHLEQSLATGELGPGSHVTPPDQEREVVRH